MEEIENLPTEVMMEVTGSGVLAVDCGVRYHKHTHTHTHTHTCVAPNLLLLRYATHNVATFNSPSSQENSTTPCCLPIQRYEHTCHAPVIHILCLTLQYSVSYDSTPKLIHVSMYMDYEHK